ncbi:hypothetical protein [Hirschia baltica]|uniref:Uncharacterized protein n=1 Tax=Hirschia baltica (strain ATCC 49814 / DSM 5838 / IFAM 1418) TaxID=582402 RepID=C6XNH6_HIRBI|nr:hypothetical protein [Hirschia baltica]ACT60120.1 hypothetical protein Hbal_2440 [Hirschia baltica ATCC 49814]
MDLKILIRSDNKKVESLGEWKQGHIPRSSFPMSKVANKQFKYGKSYSWRVVKLNIEKYECRILLLLNEEKQIFRARLGVEVEGDMRVMCEHEWHASEPGWHCHINRKTIDETYPGQVRGGTYRWPKQIVHDMFQINRGNAVDKAFTVYNVNVSGTLL